jgi:hypothetical protein
VGLALVPLPQAESPVFSAAAGLIPQTTYYARASWVGASGQEGTPSVITTYDAPAGSLPVVAMMDPPVGATGFNVYLGLMPDGLALQNPVPVPVGQSFTLPETGLAAGRATVRQPTFTSAAAGCCEGVEAMAKAGSIAARKTVEFLTAADTGLGPVIGQIADESGVDLAVIPPAQVTNQNVAFDLHERAQVVKYPAVYVYTDRIRNLLTEKFRRFSGKVRMVAEVRVSQDRIEGVEEQLRLYVEAVTQVLDTNRGSWGEGAFFTGGYEVSIEPVRHGGRNFLQIAKVVFEVDLSS